MSFVDALKSALHGHDLRSIELEFRVGFQSSGVFQSSIPKLAWVSAKNKLADGVETNSVDKYIHSRPGYVLRHVTTSNGSYMEHKRKVVTDVVSLGSAFSIRGAISLEAQEPAIKPPNSYVMQRIKHRTSFTNGPWRVDFTRVEIIPIKNDVEELFEIEVELADVGYFFEKEIDLVINEGRKLAHSLVTYQR